MNCAVEGFLVDFPLRVKVFSITNVTKALLADMSPAQISATATYMQGLLKRMSGPISLASRKV